MMSLFSEREVKGTAAFVLLSGLLILVFTLVEPRPTPDLTETIEQELESRDSCYHLAPFDPNTADYEALRALGMTRYEAVSLLKFRASGKVFRIPEDVALCYGISDSAYRVLAPYIIIAEEYRIKPHPHREYAPHKRDTLPRLAPSPFRIDTVSAAYLRAIGALTKRQAEVFIRWRDRSGFRDMEEVRACYVVDDSVATALEPYILFPERDLTHWEAPVELNTADSARLRKVVGIGPKTVVAILEYRQRLGGFHRVEQLAEVKGVTEQNYEKILQQICCDSNEIQKIDINFASPNELMRHPYMAPRSLRRLIKHRALKGGWSSTREMIEQNILTEEEAERLRPYLVFGADSLHNAQ
ncbi:MAG: helix-hairpin-helix domain-containing protein [Alistipes sp.]|nr:helix-hairpin-helix domain-containing protein [Alistipes sp.]